MGSATERSRPRRSMADAGPLTVRPAGALVGELAVPGDKSISHRAVMVGALSDERVTVTGFGASADTLATVDAFRSMGVDIERRGDDRLVIGGGGMRGLREPDSAIDVRNAGTLMRILPGILAGQRGTFVLDGDDSVRRRPRGRIDEPRGKMGVRGG